MNLVLRKIFNIWAQMQNIFSNAHKCILSTIWWEIKQTMPACLFYRTADSEIHMKDS